MSVLGHLRRQRGLYARCPHCEEDFRLSDANLFDGTKPLPSSASAYLEATKQGIADERAAFKRRQASAKSRSRIAAESVNIGKVVERIAPSLPGFPVRPLDCRSLLEPIDYVVFQGLCTGGRVDTVLFVEVKSGRARLSEAQKNIRSLVENGKVSLIITELTEPAEQT